MPGGVGGRREQSRLLMLRYKGRLEERFYP